MLWVLVVILIIIIIIAVSKGNKKKDLEIEKLKKEVEVTPEKKDEIKGSTADELIKLKKLLDDGIINQEEFNKQKTKLLD